MTCLIWLCLFGMYYSCINAFAPCTLPQAIVASGGGILANLIPIGALGSLGTMEAGWTASAMAVGLDQGPALASGLAVHTTLVICAGLLTGLGYLGHRGRQRP
jgi:uncharacterized membrane protein YbhN (UPF0104 family)